jgi:hypothetical protein
MPKQTVHKSKFAALADQGIRAYQQTEGLNLIGMAEQYIADEIQVGASTVNGWRRGRTTPRYCDDLTRFATVCFRAAPELGEQWIIDLFGAADMARYCNQALAEIRNPQSRGVQARTKQAAAADRIINLTGSVPTLPNFYIPRQAKLAALKALTLAQCRTGGWIAILGMTGAGKSTLMAALGHDPDICTTFSGNVRWFEVRQTTTVQSLIRRIALAFDVELLEEYATDSDAVAALRRVLPAEPLLLLLDNVVNPTVVNPLHALGPAVVVVVTARVIHDVVLLHIPEKNWITIAELTTDEAWALVEQVTPVPEDQIADAQAVLQTLNWHPYMTVVAASAAAALKMRWDQIGTALQNIPVRLGVIRYLQNRNRNVWAPLELDWERLGKTARYALTTLGRLPYFTYYDLPLAEALWSLSVDETVHMWKTLAAMQLVRAMPDTEECYTMHWLIRDFATAKARKWSLWQRLRFLGWPWRYRLPFRLRWWWPTLRKPKSDPRWPWYSITLPGTEGRRGLRFIGTWLIDTLWQRNRQQLNLRVGPLEWVTVMRLTVRFLAACMACLGLAVAALLTIAQGTRPPLTLAAMLVALWIVIVTYIDTRRAAMWWGLETSLPYTAAFASEDVEESPCRDDSEPGT